MSKELLDFMTWVNQDKKLGYTPIGIERIVNTYTNLKEKQKIMNKEQQDLLDKTYENYTNYPLATIHDHHTNILYQNIDKGWCMLNGRSMVSPHPTRHLTTEEFINKCKTDPEFSEMWGLKIEERELSMEERSTIQIKTHDYSSFYTKEEMDNNNIPTKQITLEYNNEKIEIYE